MDLNRKCRYRLPRPKQSTFGRGVVAIACLASLLLGVQPATTHAQATSSSQTAVTPQMLIGDSVAEVTPQLGNFIRQALAKYQEGDVAGARVWLEQAHEQEPTLPPTDVMLAKLHYAANQVAVARATLERVTLDHPTDPEAYLIFAQRALVANQVTDAELLYMKAVDLINVFDSNPKRKRNFMLRTWAGMAGVAQKRGNWTDAVPHLKAWIKDDPTAALAQAQLGTVLFMVSKGADLNQVREAHKAFEESRKSDPTRPNADLMIGQLYTRQNNRAQAEMFMDRAILGDGKTLTTVVTVAQWWLEGDRIDKAAPLLAQAVQMSPKNRDAVLLNGVAERMKKNYSKAEEYLLAAHLTSPSDFTAINQLALVLADQAIATDDQSGLPRALDFAAINVRQYPNDVNASATFGWILFQAGRQSEAEKALNNAMKQPNSLNLDSRYFIAKVMFDQGRNDVAAQYLRTSLSVARLFIYRAEAQALLDKIEKISPTPAGGEPGK